MNSQQEHEVGFWRGLVQHYGEGYRQARIDEYKSKTERFEPWWNEQQGLGLEVGCGCVSVLDDCDKFYLAMDPLIGQYAEFCPQARGPRYIIGSIEDFFVDVADPAMNDWLFCVNMLDHTPNPIKAVSEMHRILKPQGRLYFEVNFDDDAAPAHFGLWTLDTVNAHFTDEMWFRRMYTVERHDAGNQWRYWAIYEKRAA